MKSLPEYLSNTQCYIISAGFTTFITGVIKFLNENTPKEIFGLSLSIWVILFLINIWDIKTGISANKAELKKEGEKFVFKSSKGWRVPEKIGLFTLIIGFAYYFEKECIRYDFPTVISVGLLWFKIFFSFYIGLLEFQSIGENHETIYGKKAKAFHLLDKVINSVDEEIIIKIKSFFKSQNNG